MNIKVYGLEGYTKEMLGSAGEFDSSISKHSIPSASLNELVLSADKGVRDQVQKASFDLNGNPKVWISGFYLMDGRVESVLLGVKCVEVNEYLYAIRWEMKRIVRTMNKKYLFSKDNVHGVSWLEKTNTGWGEIDSSHPLVNQAFKSVTALRAFQKL